jgi:hypothetical protein
MEILSLYVVVFLFLFRWLPARHGAWLASPPVYLLSVSLCQVDHVASIELLFVVADGGGAGAPARELRSWDALEITTRILNLESGRACT